MRYGHSIIILLNKLHPLQRLPLIINIKKKKKKTKTRDRL
jgi:hypothetical protein